MRIYATVLASLFSFATALPAVWAADLQATPSTINQVVNQAGPGDTIYLSGGEYAGLNINKSGSAGAYITLKAAEGELPIVKGPGGSQGNATGVNINGAYIRIEGIVSQGWGTGGFGSAWTPSGQSGNLQFVNVIAEDGGRNGIAFYKAAGVLIEECIVAHNGVGESWSSGVNLFQAGGSWQDNIVRRTVSFENIDISANRSDGSGFILDENSQGALFENNIGFRNGGSCIRITRSSNAHIINNTCVLNGQDPNVQYHDEIFFSDAGARSGAVLTNNLAVPSSGQQGLAMGDGVPSNNNLLEGPASLLVSTTDALDFHLQSGASAAIDQGTSSDAPADDVGFNWKCIKPQSGQRYSWWQYGIDYDYIKSNGGVKPACFGAGARPQGSAPDIGAYEQGASSSADGISAVSTTAAGGDAGDGSNAADGTSTVDPTQSAAPTTQPADGVLQTPGPSSTGEATPATSSPGLAATGGNPASSAGPSQASANGGNTAAVSNGNTNAVAASSTNSTVPTSGGNAALTSGEASGTASSSSSSAVASDGTRSAVSEDGSSPAASSGDNGSATAADAVGANNVGAAAPTAAPHAGGAPGAGVVGATELAAARSAEVPAGDPSTDSGCGCRVTQPRSAQAAWLLGALGLVLAGVRRRRPSR
ncbi:right-handed parallel beta-helix repeat-containing protein [Myxococcota bacterium]